MALKVTMICGPYDRARSLIEGTVKPEGIDLEVTAVVDDNARQTAGRNLQFDACEFYTATYVADLPYKSLGLTAIPIFVKRMFRHSYIYVNKPPGRPLDPKVSEFLRFILSREGQEIIARNGPYFAIPASYVREQVKKLD